MESTIWRNWADCAQARPHRISTPATVDAVRSEVLRAAEDGLRVKSVGAGHSFTSCAVTDGVLLDLDRLVGIESVRPTEGGTLVTVFAGTRLHELNRMLWSLGLAMTNLGDIDVQTVAGAISTGTHGTGARFGGLATQVRGVQVVTADGSVLDCDADNNPELFEAARLGLGAVGILTKLTLLCEPAFALHAIEAPDTLGATLERLDHDRDSVDHFEFYWFPHTDRVLTKRNTRLPRTAKMAPLNPVRAYIDDELLSNTVFEGVNRLAARRQDLVPSINRLSSRVLSAREFTDRSYRVYASPRRVRFREMEYAIPVEALPRVLAELGRRLELSGHKISFPVEVRFAQADDVWMSTAHGRDSAYVAVHQYHRLDHTAYFRDVEAIMRSVDGRPHWGKLHQRTADDLRPAYPRFDDFVTVRDKVDPDRMFGNEYLERVLC
ncbi:D-arabinono-1,4-lactone oxidase [Speluncibacter jeojiensis]|uniref:FAD-binding protein n=1 Tax=Speluncibacter jeojiensis TaxID=2710754 RepID=A0A9X4M1N4_9ACTN|nr:FAD-binding protein [Corynebacteriales bacterium D3-21]